LYQIVLIALTILGFAAGFAGEMLFPTQLGGVPGWLLGLVVALLVLTVGSAAREQAGRMRLNALSRDLAATRLDLDGAREELAALRDQVDALPDSASVVTEIKVLQGLMQQFGDRRGQSDALAADGAIAAPAPDTPPPPVPATDARVPEPMTDHDDAEILGFIEKALREDSIHLYLQPTVLLPQRKRVFYECFSRITANDGSVIRPEQYLPIAEKAGLITAVDNLLLFRCVQLVCRARRDHLDVMFFCNISDATLTDVDFFTDFIDFMAANQQLSTSLVFEFGHATVRNPTYEVQTSLKRLSGLGFRFSVDQIEDLELELPVLAANGFKFVKIDAHLLHEMARGETPRLNMRSLKGALDREAMDLIVEKIETEEMLLDLLDLNIDFGQGYLFGEPRPTSGGG